MSEEPSEETPEEPTQEEEPSQSVVEEPRTERPQVVEIKTPLDKPEFDWFIDTFMQKMGLTDRKQSAIMLSNMLYDMGLDPYADLKDIQAALQEMNEMLKNLPNTPTTARVKDTLGAMFAARGGRAMLERFPRVGGSDPMMDRMEKIMDKYMPMIMAMRMLSETMSVEPRQREKTQADIPETIKNELSSLKVELSSLKEMLSQQKEEKEQKEFTKNLIGEVEARISPAIQTLQSQVASLTNKPEAPPQTDRLQELIDMRTDLKEAIDKMGEKAGAKQLTLADVDPLLTIIDKIEAKFKKEPTGEFDWRTATVSTLGEIGKEAITAYRDVASSATPKKSEGGLPQSQAPANAEMATIIKKQVQNYVLQRLQTGAATMNLQEAAQTLGLSVEQVAWAYQTLVEEGWINVRVPRQQKARNKGAETQNVQTEETPTQTTEEEPFQPVET